MNKNKCPLHGEYRENSVLYKAMLTTYIC